MTDQLTVPYAETGTGRLVPPEAAHPDDEHLCPNCAASLILRAGELRRLHFAHPPDTECRHETLLHVTAKGLVGQVIEELVVGERDALHLECDCERCGKAFDHPVPRRAFTCSAEEQRIGEFVCDVVGHCGDEPVLGIEILASHEIDERKGAELAIPWIELDAEAIVNEPDIWRPVRRRTKPVRCGPCQDEMRHIRRLARRWDIELPNGASFRDPSRADYIANPDQCWKCRQDILVFWWDGVPFCQDSPPRPRPRTIQNRYSRRYGDRYWANTCPGCGMIQGDNFVFLNLGGDSPFTDLVRHPSLDSKIRKVTRDEAVRKMAGFMAGVPPSPDPDRGH